MVLHIDINCDMGESYGRFIIGNDENVFPYITSCNIACGFHGGDPLHLDRTIQKAIEHGVRIGAHPSYPDLMGFGRRKIQIASEELEAIVRYQIAALKGMVESRGAKLAYVKPHGALYNTAANNESEALAIITAIKKIDSQLALMGLAGSSIEKWAEREELSFIAEAFADRAYEADGTLRSRTKKGAVIHDPEQAAKQVLAIVKNQAIDCDERSVAIKAQSICIHGDNPSAVEILKKIDEILQANHIQKTAGK